MTRELKLGLIVGFSVLLLVGILISDHLSQAHRDQVAVVDPDEAADVEQRDPLPVVEPLTDVTRDRPSSELAKGSLPDSGTSLASDDAPPTSPLPPTDGLTGVNQPEGPVVLDQSDALREAIARRVVDAGGHVVEDGSTTEIILPPRSEEAKPTEAEEAKGSTPVYHTVRKGESLFAIAKQHYGDGHQWKQIATANPGRVGSKGQVREGVRLSIPAGPQAQPVEAKPGQTRMAAERPTTAGAVVAQYKVKRGETLGEISQKVLGTSKRWREIVALNSDKIDDEDDIQAGMVLKVPTG